MRPLHFALIAAAIWVYPRQSLCEDASRVNFAREILPILSNKCFVCHGPDVEDDEMLRLDAFETATQDRGGYRAIDPAHPQQSELLVRIYSDDSPMPPVEAEKKLTDRERELLGRWVRQGGAYAKHWAFVVPKKDSSYSSIDQFISAGLRKAGVDFAPPADPATLARRTALVLTGLPPEPDQLRPYLAERSDGSFAALVEQLFASPRYGEHQARYWLDAVRYGDTHGLHLDNRRGIYPYRDWVVRAFNQNQGLDDFITWQLAGDLMDDPELEELVATGFVRMNPTTSEGGVIPAEFQAKNNFDRTETLGTVLLGMSLTCARCHTHKYDPITQTDYYRLLAFFNSTAEKALDGNSYTYGPTIKAPKDQSGWSLWSRLDEQRRQLLQEAAREGENVAGWTDASSSAQFAMLTKSDGAFAGTDLHHRAVTLQQQLESLEAEFTTTLVASDLQVPRPTKVLRRGEYDQPIGEALEPGTLDVMAAFPANAPRNRLGLAQWLTSNQHPLVARVLINRVWQRVFGYGLVRTPEDFGLQGQQPTHPELLDWLAVELQQSGWDLQHMLRLMVTSRTFRQSSAWRSDVDDPENRLWSRGPGHRLDAEVIRDIGLWASGLLDPHMGGEGVKPYQPGGMWMALAHPASNTKQYQRDKGSLLYRRSLYVYWKRTSPHPMMTLFDAPDRESSCVRRSRTNTALQSLGLLNETQRVEIARAFAERLLVEVHADDERLNQMFLLLACRKPDVRERSSCLKLVNSMRERYRNSANDAEQLVSVGDAPRKRSTDPIELAAWTQLAATVLASDIALLSY